MMVMFIVCHNHIMENLKIRTKIMIKFKKILYLTLFFILTITTFLYSNIIGLLWDTENIQDNVQNIFIYLCFCLLFIILYKFNNSFIQIKYYIIVLKINFLFLILAFINHFFEYKNISQVQNFFFIEIFFILIYFKFSLKISKDKL